jgi:Tol biopolymer transport system component
VKGGLAAALAVLVCAGCMGDDEEPLAEPTEERIVFASDRDGDFEIFSMLPDGTDVRQLTRNEDTGDSEMDDWSPAWSPDGRRIAFTSTRDHRGDGLQSQELYVMNADGTEQRRLTVDEPSVGVAGWLPDGRVAFLSCASGIADCDLMATDPDGGEPERVYRMSGVSEFAAFTPDGGRLAITTFNRAAPRLVPRIELADLDGGDREVVVENGGEPAWSPDGERLAFVTDRDRNGPCLFHDCAGNASELYVAGADGANDRRITRTTAQEVHPRWSPDGQKLLFARIESEDDDYELWVVNADGTCPRQLTDNDDWDWMADWIGPSEGGGPLRC